MNADGNTCLSRHAIQVTENRCCETITGKRATYPVRSFSKFCPLVYRSALERKRNFSRAIRKREKLRKREEKRRERKHEFPTSYFPSSPNIAEKYCVQHRLTPPLSSPMARSNAVTRMGSRLMEKYWTPRVVAIKRSKIREGPARHGVPSPILNRKNVH